MIQISLYDAMWFVLSVAGVVTMVYMIRLFIQIQRSLRKIEKLTDTLDAQLPEILSSLKRVAGNVAEITGSGKRQAQSLEGAVDQVSHMLSSVAGVGRRLRKPLDSPLIDLVKNATAIFRAVYAFVSVLTSSSDRDRK